MSAKLREAVVSKIVEDGCDSRTLRLQAEGGNPFDFHPGQYVRVYVDGGQGVLCPIASSPFEKDYLEITVRGRTGPRRALFDLLGGELVRMSGPEGSRVYHDEDRHAVLLAEGAAVAGCRSIIRYVLDKGLPNQLFLFYSEKSPDCVLFRRELEEFSRSGVPVVVSVTEPGGGPEPWIGATGPITAEALRRTVGRLKEPAYYIHGPAPFLAGMRLLLGKAGVDPGQVRAREEADC